MKEFKTIAEQISILESRGMHVGREASAILLRENYYSVINGYKDPFLDKKAMQSSADDVYVEGSRFEWVFSLFQFDRELRRITFSYLIQAEAALKTATVYTFPLLSNRSIIHDLRRQNRRSPSFCYIYLSFSYPSSKSVLFCATK